MSRNVPSDNQKTAARETTGHVTIKANYKLHRNAYRLFRQEVKREIKLSEKNNWVLSTV